MMDKSNPMDWVFMLLILQTFGLLYLMAATDGTHHFVKINTRGRRVALFAGMAIIWVPFALVWMFYGHSPVEMWRGATDWWNAEDIGFMGKFVALGGWWALLSPLQALLAVWLIRRAEASKPQQPMIIRRRS